MKVAVVCANGRVGRLVVKEAIDRGLNVTAIAKGENQTAAKQYISKDLFNLTSEDMAAYDVVVDAFGTWAEEVLPLHSKSLMHLCDILSGTEKRLVVVGGASIHETGYQIDKTKCIGCQGCRSVRPVQCTSKEISREIDRSRCLHCGNCFRICPVKAVHKLEETA